MQTVNERLAALPELLGYDSPAALAKASGLDPNTLRKAMQGPSKPGYEMLAGILSRHKQLSADWLLLGNGQPLADMPATTEPEPQGPTPPAGGAKMHILRPTYEELLVENSGLHKRVDEQAATIADLRTDKGNLWQQNKQLLAGKAKASADAADPAPVAAARMWVSHVAGQQQPGRYVHRQPEPLPRVAAGFKLQVA